MPFGNNSCKANREAKSMDKDDFETGQSSKGIENRRQREEYESIEQESQEDGSEMEKKAPTAIREWQMKKIQ